MLQRRKKEKLPIMTLIWGDLTGYSRVAFKKLHYCECEFIFFLCDKTVIVHLYIAF